MPTIIWLETNPPDSTGGRYGVFHNDDNGQAWSPTAAAGAGALATYTTTRDDFDVQASQVGTTGKYGIEIPSNLPAGNYSLVRYRENSIGSRSHANDHREARASFAWDGMQIVGGSAGGGEDIQETTVVSVSGVILELAAGHNLLDCYAGMPVMLYDVSNGNAPSQHRVITWDPPFLTIDRAPRFSVVAGDRVVIYRTDPLIDLIIPELIAPLGPSP